MLYSVLQKVSDNNLKYMDVRDDYQVSDKLCKGIEPLLLPPKPKEKVKPAYRARRCVVERTHSLLIHNFSPCSNIYLGIYPSTFFAFVISA